jgi:hypothetical protein
MIGTPAAAAAPFDGSWTVKIASNSSACKSGELPIEVRDGKIVSGNPVVNISGQVGRRGRRAQGQRLRQTRRHKRQRHLERRRRHLLRHLGRGTELIFAFVKSASWRISQSEATHSQASR